MFIDTSSFDAVLEEVVSILELAGREILIPAFHQRENIKKSNKALINGLVTEADINCSRFILEKLRVRYPGSYSEEDIDDSRFDHDLIWQVDPLDGTQEFISGLADDFAINAALLQKQSNKLWKPIAGIIHAPISGKTLFNDASGRICLQTGDDKRLIDLKHLGKPPKSLVGYLRKVAPDENAKAFYFKLGEKLRLPVDIVYGGGSGSSFINLFEGYVNLIVVSFDYSSEWDISCIEPIIKACGGFITDIFGDAFQYNRLDTMNRKGYIASIAFSPETILYNGKDTLKVNTSH